MGLAVCRSIIEVHGGTIHAHGTQPHGCGIVFRLAANRADGGGR
jgi:K+-sensing histidine kinase KdpD